MKKTISIIILLLLVLSIATVLVACNETIETPVKYDIAIVFMKSGARTYEIESWAERTSGLIQLKLKSGGVMLVDSMNCILYKGDTSEIPHY